MPDDGSDYSEELSDGEDGEYDILWLDQAEYDARLPDLLNSSSTRKKTIKSLFPHLANRIYRCSEYPQGIYINEYGQLCPDDKRSGIYRRKTDEMMAQKMNGEDSEGSVSEESVDSNEEYWEKKENKVKSLLKKRPAEKNLSDDDDYSPEDVEDEDEDESDIDELDKEIDESISKEVDHDDDWVPKHSRKKRRIIVSEDEDEDDEEDEKAGKIEDDEEEDDEEDLDEYEEEDEVYESKECEPVPDLKTLSKAQKREMYLQDLKQSAESHDRFHDAEEKKRYERIKIQKVIKFLEDFSESWKEIQTKSQKAYKKKEMSRMENSSGSVPSVSKPRMKNNTIRMSYDSHLFATNSGCDFTFKKSGDKKTVSGSLNCDTCTVVCQCLQSFSDINELYDHVSNHFLETV
jgi:hypothetical protein